MKLEELERIAKAATQGEWVSDYAGNGQVLVHDMTYLNRHIAYMPMDSMPEGEQEANGSHIAAFSPTTALLLIAELRGARECMEQMRAALELSKSAIKAVSEVMNAARLFCPEEGAIRDIDEALSTYAKLGGG